MNTQSTHQWLAPDAGFSFLLLSNVWPVFYSVGSIGTLVVYGLLQERIMTIPYAGEAFTFSVFLVFCNRLAAVCFAVVMAAAGRESFWNQAPLWKFLVVSCSNVFASTCQYESLKYVSFAVQMLGKSFKMMPVMLWGMSISGKSYGIKDWAIAATVTLGVLEFLLTGPIESPTQQGSSFRGFVLLAVFLALDGLTSTMQEKLFSEHRTSKYNQMFYINLMSSSVSLVTLLSSGKVGSAWSYFLSHGRFALDSNLLSLSAVASQFFIYTQVKESGALVYAATMNVRQIVSILVSYAMYGHFVTLSQAAGLLAVCLALLYKSYSGLTDPRALMEKEHLMQKEPQEGGGGTFSPKSRA